MVRIRDDFDIDDLVQRYLNGTSELQLSKDLKASRALIRDRLLSRNVEIRGPKAAQVIRVRAPLPEQVGTGTLTELRIRYESGESSYTIASAFGVSRYVIEYRLSALGIVRSLSERKHLIMNRLTLDERRALSEQARRIHSIRAAERRPWGPKKPPPLAKPRDVLGWQSTMADLRYQTGSAIGKHEMAFADVLRLRGLVIDQQVPIGPYNLDIRIDAMDIEIETDRNHPLSKARRRQRLKNISNAGFAVLYLWVPKEREFIYDACADYVVAYLEDIASDPSCIGKHRVIRGNGKRATTSGGYLYDWPLVPAPPGFFD